MNMEGRQGKKDTGRPRNEFAWSHVTKKAGSNRWKCNYCEKDYAGSASRIVNHLSGHGGGISRCEGVPPEIRQEALKYKSNKTRAGEDGNAAVAAATNMNNTEMVNGGREERDVDPLPNNNNAVSVEPTYVNNNSNPNDQSIREERDTQIGHSSLAIPAAAAAAPSSSHGISSVVRTSGAFKTLPQAYSHLLLDDNAAADGDMREGREREVNATDSSVALLRDYLISKSAPTDCDESTHTEMRRIHTATDSSLFISSPPPPIKTTTDTNVQGFINPRADLAPTGSTLPRINEPDHNPIDATPEDMEEDNMSGRGRAFPQPAQYEEPAVTSRAPRRSTRISLQDSKRARVLSSVSSANNGVPNGGHEHVIDAFVKFQMCFNNVSPMPSDFAMDPSLREFVESVGKHGVPSSLLGVDSSLARKNSWLKIKHEVERNMLMLNESWKTTGCTIMAFDLNKHYKKGQFHPYRSMEDKIVMAIYCPKGIIFVEAPPKADDDDYRKALTVHSPSLNTDECIHWMNHDPCDHDNSKICELNHIDGWEPDDSWNAAYHICLRSEIQNLCSLNYLDSEWAGNLFDVAVRIHECLCFLGDPWYYNVLTEEDFSLDVSLFEKEASRLPIFLLIIQHDPGLQSDHRLKKDDIEAITEGRKFWSNGRQLALILECVLKFVEVMDTLVPTSGYFDMAFDKVKNIIESCRLQLGEDALQFWEELKSEIEDIANTKFFDEIRCSRLACSYLNPAYFVQQLQKEKDPLLPADKLKKALKDLEEEEDPDKIDEEVERYGQVFSKLSSVELEGRHPVKLWKKHGSDLPLLQSFALQWLSRPLSCVCEQVKEHLYQLKGADDYILRLNFRMMRHFQQLGDDIYQPISIYQLVKWQFIKYIVDNEPRSV